MREETPWERHGHSSEERAQRGQMCPLGNPVVICSWTVLVLDEGDDSLRIIQTKCVLERIDFFSPALKNISTIKQNKQKSTPLYNRLFLSGYLLILGKRFSMSK